MENNVKAFGSKLDDLIMGKNLSRGVARDMFSQVLMNEQSEAHQGAFLAAITAKGATPEEIAGSWEAIYELDTAKVCPRVPGLVENCGTGMDSLQTFNISTAASIVAAAAGVPIAKHGSRAITSRCGTVDILEVLGVDVECDLNLVQNSIERAGIGIFNGMSPKVHPVGLGRILSKIRFGTILNIAGSLANPARPKYAVRGVYSEELVLPIAHAMKEIGYLRAMVVHGQSRDGSKGMDEVSPFGKTFVAEICEDGEILQYELLPRNFGGESVFGFEPMDEDAIHSAKDLTEEAINFLSVICGKEKGPRENVICMNAAPILYIKGRAKDLKEGFSISKKMIQSGKAFKKLGHWVREQNASPKDGTERLRALAEKTLD